MLTKSDLSQIGKVVEKQINFQVGPIVEGKIEKALKPVKRDLKKIRKDLEKRFDSHTTHPPAPITA